MRPPAIVARGVSKKFVSHRSRATSLKELALRQKHSSEDFWALRDVDVEIARGETVGLIGANGSGKSTLLKVLSGILQPTSGSVSVNGRIASLLELGAGFNGELSGRDNVYLNAALLGMSRREVDGLFDDIVAFSELEDFIDNAVKNYSSGMYVRLGFAVAVHTDPDILLVDEVLAVGDEAFQQKCLSKITQFQDEGRTILLVTHALDTVEKFCTRAVVLDHGRVAFDGAPDYATGTLRALLNPGVDISRVEPPVDKGVDLPAVTVSSTHGGPAVHSFQPGDEFHIRVLVDVPATMEFPGLNTTVVIMGAGDLPIWVMRAEREAAVGHGEGRWHVDFAVAALPPLRGGFVVAVSVADTASGADVAAVRFDDSFFTVSGPQSAGLLDVGYRAVTTLP